MCSRSQSKFTGEEDPGLQLVAILPSATPSSAKFCANFCSNFWSCRAYQVLFVSLPRVAWPWLASGKTAGPQSHSWRTKEKIPSSFKRGCVLLNGFMTAWYHAVNALLLLNQPSPPQPWSPASCGMTPKRPHLMADTTSLVRDVQGFPGNTQVQDTQQQVYILTGSPGRAHQDADLRPAGRAAGSRPLNTTTAVMGLAFQGAVERAR